MFAPVAFLDSTLKELDGVLQSHTPCDILNRPLLVKSISVVHAEFELAHPFREGNGRLGRWLADLMAIQAGFPPLDWGFESNTEAVRKAYFAAMARAYARDYAQLESLISSALKDS